MEIPSEQFFSLAWLLAHMKSASLVSCVVNKPNMQLTNYANDFVNTKSHTCKRETCSQAGGGRGGGGVLRTQYHTERRQGVSLVS